MLVAASVAPVPKDPPPAVVRPFVGLPFVGAAVCSRIVRFDRPMRSASSFSSVVKSGIVSPYLRCVIYGDFMSTAKLRNGERLVTHREPSELPAIDFYLRAFQCCGYGPRQVALALTHTPTARPVRLDATALRRDEHFRPSLADHVAPSGTHGPAVLAMLPTAEPHSPAKPRHSGCCRNVSYCPRRCSRTIGLPRFAQSAVAALACCFWMVCEFPRRVNH